MKKITHIDRALTGNNPEERHPHRLAAIMFTDVVGYSRWMNEDEAQAIRLVEQHRKQLIPLIEAHGGTLIDAVGDSLFACFDSAIEAASAAIDMQRAMDQFSLKHNPGNRHFQIRIGIHVGDIVIKNKRAFGDGVNIAARIEPLARPGGICVTQTVFDLIRDKVGAACLPMGQRNLKNIPEPVNLFQLIHEPTAIERLGESLLNRLPSLSLLLNHLVLNRKALRSGLIIVGLALVIPLVLHYSKKPTIQPTTTQYYNIELRDFKNLSDSTKTYLSQGITDVIGSQLTNIPRLYLVGAQMATDAPLRLEGSIQHDRDRLRITYRLVRNKDQVQLGAGVVDGMTSNIFKLQDKAASKIAAMLGDILSIETAHARPVKLTHDVTAYDYYLQGHGYLRQPKNQATLANAVELFTRALSLDPEFARAYAGLCVANVQSHILGHDPAYIKQAESDCHQALGLDNKLTAVHTALGELYLETGKYNDAITHLNKAISFNQKDFDAYHSLAFAYSKLKQPQQAEATFQKAIQHHPGYFMNYQMLGIYLFYEGRLQESARAFQTTTELAPSYAYAHSNYGVTQFLLGDFDQALSAYQKSLSINKNELAYTNLAKLYYYQRDFSKAKDHYLKALDITPRYHIAWRGLAEAYSQLENSVEESKDAYIYALKYAEERLEVNAQDSEALLTLAAASSKLGDTIEASTAIAKLLALVPEDPETQFEIALIWKNMGQKQRSLKALEKALRLGLSTDLFKLAPDLDDIRNEPGFRALLDTG